MSRYFVMANSCAAPFFSDSSGHFIHAKSPADALEKLVKGYDHPAGLYSVACYLSADEYHEGKKPKARWLCDFEIEKERVTKGMGSYSYRPTDDGFEVNGTEYKASRDTGRIVA